MAIHYNQIARYGEIVSVLVRYGFGDLLSRLNVQRYLRAGGKFLRLKQTEQLEKVSPWERVRMALEELGTTFIKLGQFASNRPDILPYDLIQSLEKLQDAVSPFPQAQAVAIIEHELGRPIDQIFDQFDKKPFASASIAQVHRARLKDGREAAVKVQRPHLEETITTDIAIMRHLAVLAENHMEEMRIFNLKQLVEEFAGAIRKEIDFSTEAQHIEGFAANFKGDPDVHVPAIYYEYSTKRVITTEFIHGIKITNIEELLRAGLDPREIARRGADLILKQIFVHGFFHADPHAGNILIMEGNVVCFLDLGMAGIVTPRTRRRMSSIMTGIVRRDPEQISRVLCELTAERIERKELLEYEVAEMVQEYASRPMGAINVSELMRRLSQLMIAYRFKLVPGFYLLVKSLITLEGIGYKLDPQFNLMQRLAPFARRLIRQQHGPRAVSRESMTTIAEFVALLHDFPSETRDLAYLVKSGRLQIGFKHAGLEPMIRKLDEAVNRLVYGLVLAALVIGSSVMVLSNIPPKIHGLPVIGVAGYLTAGIMGFSLLLSITRRHKQL